MFPKYQPEVSGVEKPVKIAAKVTEQTRPRFNREELTEIYRAVFKFLPKLGEQALREVFRKIRNTGKRRASRTAMPLETSSEKCVQRNV